MANLQTRWRLLDNQPRLQVCFDTIDRYTARPVFYGGVSCSMA